MILKSGLVLVCASIVVVVSTSTVLVEAHERVLLSQKYGAHIPASRQGAGDSDGQPVDQALDGAPPAEDSAPSRPSAPCRPSKLWDVTCEGEGIASSRSHAALVAHDRAGSGIANRGFVKMDKLFECLPKLLANIFTLKFQLPASCCEAFSMRKGVLLGILCGYDFDPDSSTTKAPSPKPPPKPSQKPPPKPSSKPDTGSTKSPSVNPGRRRSHRVPSSSRAADSPLPKRDVEFRQMSRALHTKSRTVILNAMQSAANCMVYFTSNQEAKFIFENCCAVTKVPWCRSSRRALIDG